MVDSEKNYKFDLGIKGLKNNAISSYFAYKLWVKVNPFTLYKFLLLPM